MHRDVLIVDDDPDMIEAIELVLHRAGYATRSAENGQRALEEVATQMPALVLLDLLMPVMDGWRCVHALRARYGRSLPIVMVSAAEHVRSRAAESAVQGVLPKPFEVGDLLGVVARFTEASPVRPGGA